MGDFTENADVAVYIVLYRITRMFCEHQTFANFAKVDQFATIKSAKPKLFTHDPCQNAIAKEKVYDPQNIL